MAIASSRWFMPVQNTCCGLRMFVAGFIWLLVVFTVLDGSGLFQMVVMGSVLRVNLLLKYLIFDTIIYFSLNLLTSILVTSHFSGTNITYINLLVVASLSCNMCLDPSETGFRHLLYIYLYIYLTRVTHTTYLVSHEYVLYQTFYASIVYTYPTRRFTWCLVFKYMLYSWLQYY